MVTSVWSEKKISNWGNGYGQTKLGHNCWPKIFLSSFSEISIQRLKFLFNIFWPLYFNHVT